MAVGEKVKYIIHTLDGKVKSITASGYRVGEKYITLDVGYRHYRLFPKEQIKKIEKLKIKNPTIV